ncbi:MAG TPA: O-antigen ligase family protein [Candidatus Limnocylindrales bacterium]
MQRLERALAIPSRTTGANLRSREFLRVAAAVLAFLAVLVVTAQNQHAPYDIQAGVPARAIAGVVPLAAAAVAWYAVMKPWPAFLAVLLLTPIFDVAQVSWTVGPLQVIFQTLFVAVLALGLVLRPPRPATLPSSPLVVPGTERAGPSAVRSGLRARTSPDQVAAVAIVGFLLLATLSTALSPDQTLSATILLHGILEPAAMGFILLALRPTRSDLIALLMVVAISVGIGGSLNMIQSIPAMKTLGAMQTDRLFFSRITYFNVGLFGEMLAMALPLLLATLLAHRRGHLQLRRAVVALLISALAVSLISLFLTFSKSAYLAAFGGCLVLLLLVVQSWRRRASIVLILGLLSTAVIPWPAFFLQVAPPLQQAYRTTMITLIGESRYNSWDPSTLQGEGSLLERWYATRAAMEMAVDHPLLGIGLDQFKGQYLGHYRPPEAHLDLDWAHSMFPEVAAELGLPALILALTFYAAAMLALWRMVRAPPDPLTRLLACALLAVVVSWLLVGTAFAGDMYRPWRNMSSDYVMMAVLVAGAFALYRMTRRQAPQAAVSD